ncbi:MAG: glycine cleavage system protein R [Gammaproteobacteria bacterium]|nr:glycine cleavage system protein R [Gammaproteobacteria bacterium]
MARAVISTIGRDRPGIVNELTKIVLELNISVEDSRMTVLGGEFAVLMSVTGSEASLETLEKKLTELCQATGLAHLFRKTEVRTETTRTILYLVKVVAMDHPGIVHNIAAFFSARTINIRDLNTETERAPHTGTPIFNLNMTVEIAADLKVSQLRDEFEEFCVVWDLDGELMADSTVPGQI